MRIAAIKLDLGDKETAAKLFGAAEALLDSLGAYLVGDQRDYYEKRYTGLAPCPPGQQYLGRGRDMGLEAAIALAQAVPVRLIRCVTIARCSRMEDGR